MSLIRFGTIGRFFRTLLLGAALFFCLGAEAAPSFTVQGRITRSDGTLLESAGMEFKVAILSPTNEQCILYEETFTNKDMTGSKGLFSLTIGNASGARSDTYNSWSMTEAFANLGSFTVSSSHCGSGSGMIIYTPGANDERRVLISFKEPSFAWEQMPVASLSHSPYAMESRAVAGFGADALCRVADAGVPQNVAALTSANFTELMALINGTSTQYLTKSATTGSLLPQTAGTTPGSAVEGSVWYDSTNHVIKYKDNGGIKTVGTSTGSVTSLATGTGLTGGPITQTGTISLANSGVTAAVYGTATKVPTITVDATGRITTASETSITGLLPSGNSGEVLKHSGSAWSGALLTLSDLKSSAVGHPSLFDMSTACSSSKTLSYDSIGDLYTCVDIGINATQITTGTIATARLPASANAWGVNTNSIYYGGGNVGIGTTTPTSELHIVTTRVSGLAPALMIEAGKTAGQAATVAFQRANSAHQALFSFETGSSGTPDGYVGTLGGKSGNIYLLSGNGAGTKPAIGVDSTNGLVVGTSGSIGSSFNAQISGSGSAYFAGQVGIGVAVPLAKLHVSGGSTALSPTVLNTRTATDATSGTKTLLQNTNNVAAGADTAGLHAAFHNTSQTTATDTFNHSGAVIGSFYEAYHRGSGTLASLHGLRMNVGQYTGSGGVSEIAGIKVNPFNQTTNNVPTYYGVSLGGLTGPATHAYGIYSASSSSATNDWGVFILNNKNYFAGSVGIGTASPTATLDVYGTIKATNFSGAMATGSFGVGSNGAPSMSFTGDADTGFYNPSSNNTISIAAGGAKIFDVSSAGIVSPTTGGAAVATANGDASTPTYGFTGDAGLGWFRPAAGTLAAATGSAERMRISSAGLVGIGTTTPTAGLDTYNLVVRARTNTNQSYFEAVKPDSYSLYGFSITDGTNRTFAMRDHGSADGRVGLYSGNGRKLVVSTELNASKSLTLVGSSIVLQSAETPYNDFLTAANGSIGIGTSAPSYRLHVEASATGISPAATVTVKNTAANGGARFSAYNSAGTGAHFNVYGPSFSAASLAGKAGFGSDTGIRVFTDAASASAGTNDLEFSAGGYDKLAMIIKAAGTVGIGTNNPQTPLETNGFIRATRSGVPTQYIEMGSVNGADLSLRAVGANKYLNLDSLESTGTVDPNYNSIIFRNGTTAAPVERMRIAGSGNVGIGTVAPTEKLEVVNGKISVSGTGAGFQVGNAVLQNGVNAYQLNTSAHFSTTGLFAVGTTPVSGYTIRTNVGFHVLSDGTVGIGTLTPGSGTKLNVNGQIKSGSAAITTGAVDFNLGNTIRTSFDCSTDLTFANLRDGGSYQLVVTEGGTTQCNFSTAVTGDDAGPVAYRFRSANGVRSGGSHTIYSIFRAGNVVYVDWSSGW